jgi:hypothetical protein
VRIPVKDLDKGGGRRFGSLRALRFTPPSAERKPLRGGWFLARVNACPSGFRLPWDRVLLPGLKPRPISGATAKAG